MISIKKLVFYILCITGVVLVIAGYYGSTSSATGKTKTSSELPESKYGIVTGILYSQDNPVAIIAGEILHEGDTVENVKLVKIYTDQVEFERKGKRWMQDVNEEPNKNWPKK